jgi:hypothetical protein
MAICSAMLDNVNAPMHDICMHYRLHDRDPEWKAGDPLSFRTPAYGKLRVRRQPHFISHPMLSFEEKPEEYAYCLLVLFKPHRNEIEELIDPETGSSIEMFKNELATNEQMAAYHEKLLQFAYRAKESQKAIEEEAIMDLEQYVVEVVVDAGVVNFVVIYMVFEAEVFKHFVEAAVSDVEVSTPSVAAVVVTMFIAVTVAVTVVAKTFGWQTVVIIKIIIRIIMFKFNIRTLNCRITFNIRIMFKFNSRTRPLRQARIRSFSCNCSH